MRDDDTLAIEAIEDLPAASSEPNPQADPAQDADVALPADPQEFEDTAEQPSALDPVEDAPAGWYVGIAKWEHTYAEGDGVKTARAGDYVVMAEGGGEINAMPPARYIEWVASLQTQAEGA